MNKIPGLNLRSIISKAVYFIDKDIKQPLGLAMNNNIVHSEPEKRASLLGSMKNVFNKIVNKKEEKIKSYPVAGSYEDINDYDKFLITVSYSEFKSIF